MTIRIIKEEDFKQNFVGKVLGLLLFSNDGWRRHGKLAISTTDQVNSPHPIHKCFNLVLRQLKIQGVDKIIIMK